MIIPVLNEIENIDTLIQRLQKSDYNSEFLFVDDGSDDGTREVIKHASEINKNIVPVFNNYRLGHMGSYLAGLKKATSDNIIIMDGDLQHPPEVLPEFYKVFLSGFKIIIGTRYMGRHFNGYRKLTRGIISRGAEIILKAAVPRCRNIIDPLSGYIGFKHSLNIPVDAKMKGNKLLPFLLVSNPNAKVGYVPYKFSEREGGKSKIVSGGTNFVWNYIREVQDIRRTELSIGTNELKSN